MKLFSKIKSSVVDWVSGNSLNYSFEEEVYSNIMDLIDNLEEELEKMIEMGTLADKWAIIDFQNSIYTLPLLKSLIKEKLNKSQNCSMEEMNTLVNYAIQLQEMYDKYEQKIKKRIVKNAPAYGEFQEIYYILIEIRKILASHMNLEAIGQCDYHDISKFPSYNNILKLKMEIAKRRTIILPYLSEMDYNKGR